MPDSVPGGAELPYRLQSVERQTDEHDERINLLDDRVDEFARKQERLVADVRAISGVAREARDVSARLQKRVDEEEARKKWAANAAETRTRNQKAKLALIAVIMAIISAGVSLVGGYAQQAWDRLTSIVQQSGR